MAIKLSVVIPCFNEEKRFIKGINHFLDYFKNQRYAWELVLVNDGSHDSTLQLMRKLSLKYKNLKIVSYKNNQGKGYALVKGVKKAKGQIILFSDIDHAVSIDTIESFLHYFNKGIVAVIGSRRVNGSKIVRHQNQIRELLGQGFTLLVRLLIDSKIKDATCGFKAFKKDIAKKIFSKITIYDWAFDAELLYLCKIHKIDIVQAPVYWSDVKGSKVSILKDIISSFAGLIKIRLNDFFGKYK